MISNEDQNQEQWYRENVLPHEPMIRRWLTSRYGSLCDVDDVMQESLFRVFQAHRRNELKSPKAFLFAVARNVAVEQIRRSKVGTTELRGEWDEIDFLDQANGIEETAARNNELEILTEAIQALPDRCRRIFTLAKVYGMSYKAIGEKLAISTNTVSAQITIGMEKVTAFLEKKEDLNRI